DPARDHRRTADRRRGAEVERSEGVHGPRAAVRRVEFERRSAGRGGERIPPPDARREAELTMELHERLSTNGSAEGWGNGNDPFAELKNRIHLALVSELGPRLFDVADSDAVRQRVQSEIDEQLRQEAALSHDDRERLPGGSA